MQDTDLLLSLAEIAGVFVGFGALIAVRSGGVSGIAEIAYMRGVVSMGMLTIAAALAPVILGRYDLAAHEVWVLSSGVVLVGWLVWFVSMVRTPEYRANLAAELEADRATRKHWVVVVEGMAFTLYLTVMTLGPIIIVLGLQPQHEPALYATVVALILLGAGWTLLNLVFSQRGSQTA
jgi:L-asparagine transporter-like permease